MAAGIDEDDSSSQPADGVKITIRPKRVDGETSAALQTEIETRVQNDARMARLLAGDDDSAVFVVKFYHVKPALGTLLKFWLMGDCGAVGWGGTNELDAQHTSGTKASIVIDAAAATVSLLSPSEPSYNKNVQLGRYATALLDELESVATAEEVAEVDRLCHPPEAIASARTMATASLSSGSGTA